MGVNILANINIASGASSTGSWATMTGMSVSSVTVQATSSVLLLMVQVQVDPAGDASAEFRFNVNSSTANSPVLIARCDSGSNQEASAMTLLYAVTGLSGSSNSFALEWKTVSSGCAADTTRNRTFQILEITGGDATIKVDSGVADQTGDPGSWGNLFQTTGVSIAGTDSVIIMLGNVPINLEADESTDFQFGVDNTGEGAVTCGETDSTAMGTGWSGMHVTTGLAATTHSFELKWQARTGAGQTDSARRRTFQVIEVTANAVRKLNLVFSSSGTAPGTWGNVDDLSSSYTVDGTSAVALIIGNMMIAGDSSDATCDFSIGVDGSNEGAELIGFADNANIVGRICMPRLKTGLSAASHSFQLRWLEIAGASVADTGRARSLQVVEFAVLTTYKVEGVTKNKTGGTLGTCKCFLLKDNGDSTYSFIAYQQSDGSGNYSFTGLTDGSSVYQVVAWKDDTPHVFDVTDNVLVPVAE